MHMNGARRIASRTLLIAAYILITTVVTGCEQSGAPGLSGKIPKEGDRIIIVGDSSSDAQWPGIAGGARRYMAKYPGLLLETAAPPDNRGESLLKTVQQIIKTKPQVVCIQVHDPKQAQAALQAVHDAGIPLITIGVKTEFARVFGHVQDDIAGAAELLGANLETVVADKRSYMVLSGQGDAKRSAYICERFMSKARGFHGITLLEERDAAAAPPAETIRAMFERFPNAGLVVTFDSSVWLSESPSKLLGKNARFATVGAAPVLWKYLQSGQAAALAGVDDGELGSLAMELAIAALTESRAPGALKMARARLVTRETLADFMKRYAESAGLNLRKYMMTATSRPATGP